MNSNADVLHDSCLSSYFSDVLCSKMFLKIAILCEKCKDFHKSNNELNNKLSVGINQSTCLDELVTKLKADIEILINQHENFSSKVDFYKSNIGFLHEIVNIIDQIYLCCLSHSTNGSTVNKFDNISMLKYVNERIVFISGSISEGCCAEQEIMNAMENIQHMLKDLCEFELKFFDNGLLSSIFAPLNKSLKDDSKIIDKMQYSSDVYNFLFSKCGSKILDTFRLYISTLIWEFMKKLERNNNSSMLSVSLRGSNHVSMNTISDAIKQKINKSLLELQADKYANDNSISHNSIKCLEYSSPRVSTFFNLLQLFNGNINEQQYDEIPKRAMDYDYNMILSRFIEQISYIAYDDLLYKDADAMADFHEITHQLIKLVWDYESNIIKNATIARIFKPMLANNRNPVSIFPEGLQDQLSKLDEIPSHECTLQKIISINGLTIHNIPQK